jgi:hypothetical protein
VDKEIINWLMSGPAWLRYAVATQLLDEHPDAGPALADSDIKNIVSRLKDHNAGLPAIKIGKVHYTDTGKAYWDLFLLADTGLKIDELGLRDEAEPVFRFQQANGSFVMPPNVKDNYFCMSAILISSLARMGYRDDPRVEKYIRAALAQQTPGGGWDCYGDGFGYQEACPMDNLNLLMLLGQYEKYRDSSGLNGAIDLLLEHWETGSHLYGFGIGRRFRSLQYPAVKYGILRVLDVLSLFPYAINSRGFTSMLDFVRGKARGGKYYAEMTDAAYRDFDFSQTEEPSRWITFLINRIEKRANE